MQRVCFTLQVKPDRLDDYRLAHRDVWPEMLDALRRHGWHNYSLFLRTDGLLIGYVETPSLEKALSGMQDDEVNMRWQEEMKDYFVSLESGAAYASFEVLDQAFYLE